MNEKIFHDTVHGDICVASDLCISIIDTPLFQRLRRIEQTSMRSLYPCARHDRFIHSIGVYHLGSEFVKHIGINTEIEDAEFWRLIQCFWTKIKSSYVIACLLHDIGHSPFSHTFEEYFDLKQPKLTDQLKNMLSSEEFNDDFDLSPDPKPHEKISAIIAYTKYKDQILDKGGDPVYVVRMIMGVKFSEPANVEQKVVNCIVPLLHGVIDVDRLDYACRDQWASGFTSARVNLRKIIHSGLLVNKSESVTFCFQKNAISQLQSLIEIKNYQKTWVFGHHKVLYDQHVLKKSIDKLASQLADTVEQKDDVLSKIFSLNVFLDKDYMLRDSKLYLLSDDDIIHLLKQGLTDNIYAQEWLYRSHSKKPLWKTESQYIDLFPNSNLIDKKKIVSKIQKFKSSKGYEFNYEILSAKRGVDSILKNDVMVYINKNIVDFSVFKYGKSYVEAEHDPIFYVYIDKDFMNLQEQLIDEIKSIK